MIEFGRSKNLYMELSEKDKISNSAESRQKRFDAFLTYRKNLSRLASIQCTFLWRNEIDFAKKDGVEIKNDDLYYINKSFTDILYSYKKVLFINRYGNLKKQQKLDERFVKRMSRCVSIYFDKINELIVKELKNSWSIEKMNPIIYAILLTAICEMIVDKVVSIKTLLCEYVNISNALLNDEQCNFVHAVLNNVAKDIDKINKS